MKSSGSNVQDNLIITTHLVFFTTLGGIKWYSAEILFLDNFNQGIRKSKNGSVLFEFGSANTREKETFRINICTEN